MALTDASISESGLIIPETRVEEAPRFVMFGDTLVIESDFIYRIIGSGVDQLRDHTLLKLRQIAQGELPLSSLDINGEPDNKFASPKDPIALLRACEYAIAFVEEMVRAQTIKHNVENKGVISDTIIVDGEPYIYVSPNRPIGELFIKQATGTLNQDPNQPPPYDTGDLGGNTRAYTETSAHKSLGSFATRLAAAIHTARLGGTAEMNDQTSLRVFITPDDSLEKGKITVKITQKNLH